MKITDAQLHILRHSLGVDDHGYNKSREPGYYRNYFVSPPDADLEALCAAGLMRCDGQNAATGDTPLYRVTDAGKALVEERAPKKPRFTRAQQRYRDFLNTDCGWTFIEYLRAVAALKKEGRA